MRVLALVPDAFGGYGGIAKYNRDLLRALCAYPTCSEVVAIPRQMPMRDAEALLARLTYVTSGLGGKRDYLVTVLRVVHSSPRFDLVLCGHINLLPVAFLLRLWARAPVALFIHGLEAWRPTRRPLTNFLSSRVDFQEAALRVDGGSVAARPRRVATRLQHRANSSGLQE